MGAVLRDHGGGEGGVGVSKPRYDWWPYVKGMIRRYPALVREYGELHTMPMTVSYSDNIGGGAVSRSTETVAVRELPSTKQREYEAVRRAIETTGRYRNGRERLQVVKLVLWDRSHTLEGAALVVPCGIATAKRWHGEFIIMTASYYGLLD